MDKNSDGAVDELEYITGMLVRTGRVDADLIQELQTQFRAKHKTGFQTITMQDIASA